MRKRTRTWSQANFRAVEAFRDRLIAAADGPEEVLMDLVREIATSKRPVLSLLAHAAGYPGLSPKVQVTFLEVTIHPKVRTSLAGNPSVCPEAQEKIIDYVDASRSPHGHGKILKRLAANPNITLEVQERLALRDSSILAVLASNPSLAGHLQERLVLMKNNEIAVALAGVCTSAKVQRILFEKFPSRHVVRSHLARNQNLSVELQCEMVLYPTLALYLSASPSLAPEAQAAVISQKGEVRWFWSRHRRDRWEGLGHSAAENLAASPVSTLETQLFLSKKNHVDVNWALQRNPSFVWSTDFGLGFLRGVDEQRVLDTIKQAGISPEEALSLAGNWSKSLSDLILAHQLVSS